MLLGKDRFDTQLGKKSATKECSTRETTAADNHKEIKIIVTDTPGFLDTEKAEEIKETILAEILKQRQYKAILFVIKLAERFPDCADVIVNDLKEIFGEDIFR